MKKQSYLKVLFFSFLLIMATVDCKKEETIDHPLVGKWNAVSSKITNYENNVKMDEETIIFQPGEAAMEFLANRTGKSYTNGTVVQTFKWEVNGDILKITTNSISMEAQFTISDNTFNTKTTILETSNGIAYKTEADAVYSRD